VRDIKLYKSKQFKGSILKVHRIHTEFQDSYQYIIEDTEFNVGNVFLAVMGVKVKPNEWRHIDKEELDRQLKEYGWKKVRKRK
jgi:hypothetical protein